MKLENVFIAETNEKMKAYTGTGVELPQELRFPFVELTDEKTELAKSYKYPVFDWATMQVIEQDGKNQGQLIAGLQETIKTQNKTITEQNKTIKDLNQKITDLTDVTSGLSEVLVGGAE